MILVPGEDSGAGDVMGGGFGSPVMFFKVPDICQLLQSILVRPLRHLRRSRRMASLNR